MPIPNAMPPKFAPSLKGDRYTHLYNLRRNASSMTTACVFWLSNNLPKLLPHIHAVVNRSTESPPLNMQRPISILSVGAGCGDVDIPVLTSLLNSGAFRPGTTIQYTALEPLPLDRESLHDRLEALASRHFSASPASSDGCTLEVNVLPLTFQEFHPPSPTEDSPGFDIILFSHVLYYFQEPSIPIARAARMLVPDTGRLVIVHQTDVGVPEVQRLLMESVKGNMNDLLCAKEVDTLLSGMDMTFERHDVDAFLTLPTADRNKQNGKDGESRSTISHSALAPEALEIISFCMECDLATLGTDDPRVQQVLHEFLKRCVGNVLREPIAIFAIEPLTETQTAAQDDDPVSDYRELAQNIQWGDLFNAKQKRLSNTKSEDVSTSAGGATSLGGSTTTAKTVSALQPIRLLDVGCGSGRWLKALSHYTDIGKTVSEVLVDAVDPDGQALSTYISGLPAPFMQGKAHNSCVQFADLEARCYDMVWTVHSMYGVPRSELSLVIAKIAEALADDGIAMIAMPTRASGYVAMHEQYMSSRREGSDSDSTRSGGDEMQREMDIDSSSSRLEENNRKDSDRFTAYEDVLEAIRENKLPYRVRTVYHEERFATDDEDGLTHYVLRESMANVFAKEDTENLESNFLSEKDASFSNLIRLPDMAHYFQQVQWGKFYYIPQDVKVVTFARDRKVLSNLSFTLGTVVDDNF